MSLVPASFLTTTLRGCAAGARITRILSAGLAAVDPAAAIERFLHITGHTLAIGNIEYDLRKIKRIYLVGAGKAGEPMAYAAAKILGSYLTAGCIIVKYGHIHLNAGALPSAIQVHEAAHPIPDQKGIYAAHQLVRLLQQAGEQDLVICLISGGGSALLNNPSPGISLYDLQALTQALLACGATIHEINTIRKHLDEVKGGRLAVYAHPAQVHTLVLSDVVGDPLDRIASGPTAADPSTFVDALEILSRYNLTHTIPPSILSHLNRGLNHEIPETPKPGDPVFAKVNHTIVGNNYQAAQAAQAQAETEGYHAMLLSSTFQGEAREFGRFLSAIARQIASSSQPISQPACLIAGGETTVNLTGNGLGGRNQEVALAAVNGLAGLPETILVTLATDGGDGPTDAAGAVVSGETLQRAQKAGLNPEDYLRRNDSYHFFSCLDDLILSGPTLTNVNDLSFIFMGKFLYEN